MTLSTKKILNYYQVDNLPIILRPFVWIYGFTGGLSYYCYFLFFHLTCKKVYEGKENLVEGQNYIYCLWHKNYPLYFSSILSSKNEVLMNHPFWYMKPIHMFLKMRGMAKLVLGSTGNSGRDAADQLVKCLREGYSTTMAPDGPAGPSMKLKKGILHIAAQSGAPIVPISFQCSNFRTSNTWDKRENPCFFSAIGIRYGKPVFVDQTRTQSMQEIIETSMA